MKTFAASLFFGRDNRISGLIAFTVVMLIALGCTCDKQFGIGNTETGNSGTTTSNSTTTSSNSTSTTTTPSKPDASTGAVPTDAQLQEMTKETVLAFNAALQSEDFTSFHRSVSKPFQKQVSPEKFKQVFQSFIDAGIDFSQISSLTADFTDKPVIETTMGYKTLKLVGVYPTSPRNTKFDLKYIPENKDWKLISIEINTKREGEE